MIGSQSPTLIGQFLLTAAIIDIVGVASKRVLRMMYCCLKLGMDLSQIVLYRGTRYPLFSSLE